MSPLKLRARSRAATGLTAETVGNAIVVHAPEGMSAEARSLANTAEPTPSATG